MKNPWTCPQCGKETTDYPAICRRDDKTEICSECGTAQALADYHNWERQNMPDFLKSGEQK